MKKKSLKLLIYIQGKRVNYAARSVISPDPYVDTDEIGACINIRLKKKAISLYLKFTRRR